MRCQDVLRATSRDYKNSLRRLVFHQIKYHDHFISKREVNNVRDFIALLCSYHTKNYILISYFSCPRFNILQDLFSIFLHSSPYPSRFLFPLCHVLHRHFSRWPSVMSCVPIGSQGTRRISDAGSRGQKGRNSLVEGFIKCYVFANYGRSVARCGEASPTRY